jgi:hypothetical protein
MADQHRAGAVPGQVDLHPAACQGLGEGADRQEPIAERAMVGHDKGQAGVPLHLVPDQGTKRVKENAGGEKIPARACLWSERSPTTMSR